MAEPPPGDEDCELRLRWDHDGSWELEQATPSFDATLKALTSGIERRDTATLEFFGIYLD